MVNGDLTRNHYLDLAGGEFAGTSRADLDGLFSAFEADPHRDTLVVHFHGGLNTREDGLTRARSLLPVYRAAGAYPVFFVWQSGALEVIEHQLRKIVAEPIFQRIVKLASKFTLGKLRRGRITRGGDATGVDARTLEREIDELLAGSEPVLNIAPGERRRAFRLQEAELRELRYELTNDAIFQAEAAAIANALRAPKTSATADPVRGGGEPGGYRETLMKPEILERLRPRAGGASDTRFAPALALIHAITDLVSRIHTRLANGRDHGIGPTIVEEVLLKLYVVSGWFNWMKTEISDAFGPDHDRCGGSAFLRGLGALWERGIRPRVVLIAHSAGSIYVCHFLEHAAACLPGVKFDVIFMTPACSFYRFGKALAANPGGIGSLRNLTFSDELERADRLLPVYPRSLLYFTSGVLDVDGPDIGDLPIVGMQRYYTRAAPYDSPELQAVCDFFADDARRVMLVDGSAGANAVSGARSHGDFDYDARTRLTLARMIREGL